MIKFIVDNIDAIILGMSLIAATAYTVRLASRSNFRQFPLFFVVFGAMTICMAMFGHVFENSLHALEQVIAGTFVYTFIFYSRIFMGVVFFALSLYMLEQIKIWGSGNRRGKVNFIKAAVAISVLSSPTYFLVPIGLLPTIACLISLAGMPFAVKRRKKELELQSA
jgi:hypothetical protein